MTHRFYGWDCDCKPISAADWPGVESPRDLFGVLLRLWCAETCAPRMRADWSPENPTLGQCSVTAFLAQDIFGGRVYGIPLADGGFHCYNVVGPAVFDLTCEQFGEKALTYTPGTENPEQFRELHFAKAEKQARYVLLRARLRRALADRRP